MTPVELAMRIDVLSNQAEADLNSVMLNTQIATYRNMIGVLKNLQLDRNGYIRNNAFNRQILRGSGAAFDNAIATSGYTQGLGNFTSAFEKIAAVNEAYFGSISTAFKPNKAFVTSLQNGAIKYVETMALNEGLVANVKAPLVSILNKNINSGGSFAGMLEEVRTYTRGIDREGKFLKYTRTWSADALFTFSRAYQQAITADLGLDNYYYAGGAIKDTRDFCKERLDQYWKTNEVEGWAELDWAGRNPLTSKASIFTYLGGYNCRHSLIPVHASMVPAK